QVVNVTEVQRCALPTLPRQLGERPGQRGVDGESPGALLRCHPVRARHGVGQISSLARGATTTAPITVCEPGRTMSFTKPSVMPCIFARGFVDSGSVRTSPEIVPSRTSCSLTPTTAISGLVNTAEETCPEISGETASPRAWCMAMRPCMAATEASGYTPVQSPAA